MTPVVIILVVLLIQVFWVGWLLAKDASQLEVYLIVCGFGFVVLPFAYGVRSLRTYESKQYRRLNVLRSPNNINLIKQELGHFRVFKLRLMTREDLKAMIPDVKFKNESR